ncbi:nitrogen regulatory protein P-II homolog isoform X2 [Apium graveolens]|uniref:nitrogen regulatory protein P-II homolog isoform X2 n=1 Tax=Apium graveolens TaxID=4045 RepID=UPI003D7B2B15
MASLLSMFYAPLFTTFTNCPSMLVSSLPFMRPNKRNNRVSQISVKPSKAPRDVCPVIRAQSSADYEPDAKFYKVEAILRSWRIPQVSKALLKMGINGVTVSEVRGFGSQGRMRERQAGSSEDTFLSKIKMEIVVCKNQVEVVVKTILEEGRTGQIGDGKIFVVPVADVIKVRTGERGEKVEQMLGVLCSDVSSSKA